MNANIDLQTNVINFCYCVMMDDGGDGMSDTSTRPILDGETYVAGGVDGYPSTVIIFGPVQWGGGA